MVQVMSLFLCGIDNRRNSRRWFTGYGGVWSNSVGNAQREVRGWGDPPRGPFFLFLFGFFFFLKIFFFLFSVDFSF